MKIISCRFSNRCNEYILKYLDKNNKIRYLPVSQYIYN